MGRGVSLHRSEAKIKSALIHCFVMTLSPLADFLLVMGECSFSRFDFAPAQHSLRYEKLLSGSG